MDFGTGKSRDGLCRACRIARRDMLVMTRATHTHDTSRMSRHDVTQRVEFGPFCFRAFRCWYSATSLSCYVTPCQSLIAWT